MKTIKGKMIGLLLVAALTVFIGSSIDSKAAGGSTTIGLSSSSVNIGDTVTVTLNVKSDVYASFTMHLKYDSSLLEYTGSNKSSDCNGSGGLLMILSEVEEGGTYSINISFKALAPGKATIAATALEAIDMTTAEKINISESSVSVTIKNAATEEPENPGGTDTPPTPAKSADNSLKSLTISPGTLSPTFQYSTTKYTATVASDVTSIAVDAQVSNAKATVESVTGNTDLKVGENTIKITVKAENGTLAVYTITVTRSAGAAVTPGDTPTTPADEPTDESTVIDGVSYTVSETLPEDTLPEEFIKVTAIYNNKEVEAYAFPYNDLRLLYLIPSGSSSASSAFYFYNAEEEQFFPYINITVGEIYILVLPTSYGTTLPPEGYRETTMTIETRTVSAYQLATDSSSVEGGQANDFYLIYGVDKDGTPGWYQYDASNMSAQRFNEAAYAASTEGQAGASQYIEAYNKLLDKHNEEKNRDRLIIAILIFVLAVAIIVIINILIFGRKGRGKKEEDFDYVDLDDL